MRRLVLGFVLAPLATPLAIWLTFSLAHLLRLGGFGVGPYRRVIEVAVGWSYPGLTVAYLVMLMGGVPVVSYARRRGWTGLGAFVALGAALGAAPFLLFFAVRLGVALLRSLARGGEPSPGWEDLGRGLTEMIGELPVVGGWVSPFVASGMVCAATFWIVAVSRNPAFAQPRGRRPGRQENGALPAPARRGRIWPRALLVGLLLFAAIVLVVYLWTAPPPDLIVYLKPDASPDEVRTVWNTVLSRPHASGTGHQPLAGISTLTRLDSEGRPGIRVSLHARTSRERRRAIRSLAERSPLVERVVDLD